mmetsp:Transcript_86820/g.106494  ORF Transcript_86820/g.106494 Transcript_86820/m.106494 type:complete len:167 (+) Transcript_86820:230-730(+)
MKGHYNSFVRFKHNNSIAEVNNETLIFGTTLMTPKNDSIKFNIELIKIPDYYWFGFVPGTMQTILNSDRYIPGNVDRSLPGWGMCEDGIITVGSDNGAPPSKIKGSLRSDDIVTFKIINRGTLKIYVKRKSKPPTIKQYKSPSFPQYITPVIVTKTGSGYGKFKIS